MKLSQKKSRAAAGLKYGLLALLIPLMLGASAFSISKSYGIFDLMPVNAAYQDTSKKTTTIKSNSQAKAIPSKNNTAKTLPKPKVQNVKFRPPVVVTTNSEKKKNATKVVIDEPVAEVRIDEPVISEVRIIESVNEIKMAEPVQKIKIVEPVKEIRIVEQKKLQLKKIGTPPPPPPTKPSKVKSIPRPKVENIKFPPPVLKPSRSKSNGQVPPPPPPVEPQSKSIKGAPVKEKGKSETIKGSPISE